MESEGVEVPNDRPATSPSQDSAEEDPCVYHIKWITWEDSKTPIITQNKNGPCPLLALFNVLLLSKRITLSELLEMISSRQIMDRLGDLILSDMPSDLPDDEKLNYEQNMSDAISIFPKLQTGIDVNVQFKTSSSFECTPELLVFDLLRISLYHGWLPDPQDTVAFEAVKSKSYNQVIDQIITSKDSTDEEVLTSGLAAEQFLQSNAAQLTYCGIVNMQETMKDGELAVLFRNNHFSTLYKKNSGELFTLVTDQGFLTKPNIVWETLSNIQGDTHFTDAKFLSTPVESGAVNASAELSPQQQFDQDMMIAMSLTADDANDVVPPAEYPKGSTEESDHQMASRLQQEYDEQVSRDAQRHQQQQRPTSRQPVDTGRRRTSSSDKCTIL
uniref:Ubiquitin carboxyl-terminal hydrolase n=1 Tax=Phallusia mammillata TaxID=59560 RepID=A0A6F9DBX7_9ASCI|nr:protein FAM63B [Phallusia mammillata]